MNSSIFKKSLFITLGLFLSLLTHLALAQTPIPTAYIYLPLILKSGEVTPPSPTPTATTAPTGPAYYVAPDGNDQNAGTLNQPWRTIQKAAQTVSAGSTVYVRGGIYAETVTLKVSGSAAGGYITFRNYENEKPIIDGSTLTASSDNATLITINDQSYLIIQGFELRNYKSASSQTTPIGLGVRGQSHHLEIRNNFIHHIETTASADTANAHGLAVYGTVADSSIHDITIDGNELANLKLGSSEALVINGNVESFTITNNLIHDADNIGIDIIGFEGTSSNPATDQARHGLVSQNTVYNIDTLNNPSYHGARAAAGIYVDGGTQIVVERNISHDNNYGLEFASEHAGRATSFITARNNFVYHNQVGGMGMGGYDTQRGQTTDCVIINNTFYQNDTMLTDSGELILSFDTARNVIKNNIIVTNEQGRFMSNLYSENTANIMNYNLFYAPNSTGIWMWKNKDYNSLAAYQAATGNDSQAQFIEPELTNPSQGDLHLQTTSPAINAGENLTTNGSLDIDGQPRLQGAQVDIGADERN